MRLANACLLSDLAAMEESGTSPAPVRRRRRPKPTVTNINMFWLGASPVVESAPARHELEVEPDQTLVSTEWLERRSKRLDKYEQELRQRSLELEVREAELDQREAEFEAEAFIRSEALEERERRLSELDQKLGTRETELSSYVARVQGGMLRADAL
jgi:predicted metal-dependent hydrolase